MRKSYLTNMTRQGAGWFYTKEKLFYYFVRFTVIITKLSLEDFKVMFLKLSDSAKKNCDTEGDHQLKYAEMKRLKMYFLCIDK